MGMRLTRINPILAISLMSVLATSLLSVQLSSLNSPPRSGIENGVSNIYSAQADSFPLPIDHHYELKDKEGDAGTGNKYVEIDENFIDSENSCEFCTYIKVKPGPKGKTGFAYESTEQLDLSNAKSVTFFVMGLDGGEKLSFKIAGKTVADKIKKGEKDGDGEDDLFEGKKFAAATEEVTLETDWVPFSIDLTDIPKEELVDVTHPFAIQMGKIKGEQEFYIKHVIYRTEEAELNTLETFEISNATLPVANETDTSLDNATDSSNDTDTDTETNISEVPESEETSNSTAETESEVNDSSTDESEVDPDESTENEENVGESSEVEEQENEPPVAKANDDILAYPGDVIILDGLESSDEDADDELSYQWTQSDGPNVSIKKTETAAPVIAIPSDIDEDVEVTIDLVVSDGKDESEKDSVTIYIDYVGEYDELETQELDPDGVEESASELNKCQELLDCLTDGKKNTFATLEIDEDIDKADIFSFADIELEENEELEIEYVMIQVEAAREGATGYLRFLIDDDEEPFESALVSVTSGKMAEYSLILDENPVTEEDWTLDSINSILAGYAYGGGESTINIASMKLTVLFSIIASEETEGSPEEDIDEPSAADQEEASELEDGESAAVQGNSTGGDE